MSRFHCVLVLAVLVQAGCGSAPQADNPKQNTATPAKSDGSAAAASAADFDAILKQYVQGDHFDYAALKKNQQDLARFDAFLKWQRLQRLLHQVDPTINQPLTPTAPKKLKIANFSNHWGSWAKMERLIGPTSHCEEELKCDGNSWQARWWQRSPC